MARIPPIPHDVWLHIAQFIPSHHLPNLLSVNRTFFELGMNERYRTVRFVRWDADLMKLLDRLEDDGVASRVRCLHIHSWYKPYVDLNIAPRPRRISKYRNIRSWFAHQFLASDPVGEVIRAVADAIRKMSNVTEYIIECKNFRALIDVLPCVVLVWPTFGQHLQKFDLSIALDKVVSLDLPSANLTSLQVLIIDISSDGLVPEESHYIVLYDIVAPFISRLNATLKQLVFKSRLHLINSAFFDKIVFFPNLFRFDISVGISVNSVDHSPSAMTRFISKHAETLQYFALKLTHCTYESAHRTCQQITEVCSLDLPTLRGLKIDVNACDPILSACIRRFSDTLTTLDLRGPSLRYDGVDVIVSQFSHRPLNEHLKTIFLDLVYLSPQIMDLLAEKLPGLEDLTLTFLSMASGEERRQFSEESFYQEMTTRSYPNWSLYDIELKQEFCCGYVCCWKAMRVLAICAPSIKSFNKQGDMAVPADWNEEQGLDDEILDLCLCPRV